MRRYGHLSRKKWKRSRTEGKKRDVFKTHYPLENSVPRVCFPNWRTEEKPPVVFKSPNTRYKSVEEWKAILEDCKKSDLSQRAYCLEKKITPSVFARWKKRLTPFDIGKRSSRATEKWQAIFEDYQKSGLTDKAYCLENNICRGLFANWKTRLRLSMIRRKKRSLEEWKDIVDDFEKSGLSRKDYCVQNNLHLWSFYSWKRKINPIKAIPPIDKWKLILEDWKASHLIQKDYCREKNIPYPSFCYWKRKLEPLYIKKRTPCIHSAEKRKDIVENWKRKLNISHSPGIKKSFCRRSAEEWKAIIEDWKQSSLGDKDYCLENNIARSSFVLWKKKISPLDVSTSLTRSAEEWKEIIEDWKNTGLGITPYCLEKKIYTTTFRRWILRFNPDANQLDPLLSFEERFMPVILKDDDSEIYYPPKIEVILAKGHRIILHGPFDWEALSTWLTPLLRE